MQSVQHSLCLLDNLVQLQTNRHRRCSYLWPRWVDLRQLVQCLPDESWVGFNAFHPCFAQVSFMAPFVDPINHFQPETISACRENDCAVAPCSSPDASRICSGSVRRILLRGSLHNDGRFDRRPRRSFCNLAQESVDVWNEHEVFRTDDLCRNVSFFALWANVWDYDNFASHQWFTLMHATSTW